MEAFLSSARRIDLHVGSAIRVARTSVSLSADQLSEALKLPADSLTAYELGLERVPASTLFKIAEVLGRDLSWFFVPRS